MKKTEDNVWDNTCALYRKGLEKASCIGLNPANCDGCHFYKSAKEYTYSHVLQEFVKVRRR